MRPVKRLKLLQENKKLLRTVKSLQDQVETIKQEIAAEKEEREAINQLLSENRQLTEVASGLQVDLGKLLEKLD